MLFAIDTNLLVYAHNSDSEFHQQAAQFIERMFNEYDADGQLSVCLSTQVLTEFINVMTRQMLRRPLSIQEAADVVQDYLDTGVLVLSHKETQMQTFLTLLKTVTTRKKMFDVVLAATLKDHEIAGLYTVNTVDFEDFEWLKVINPLKTDGEEQSFA
ncbi:Ribonuclease VapC [Candidatus Electronema halotolerans]